MFCRVTEVQRKSGGFTMVEVLIGVVVFGIMTSGLFGAYNAVRTSYGAARQLNEMYTVLSACPEVNRALEYTSISDATNCYPNNSFRVENDVAGTNITYAPDLSVTETSALDASDPLNTIPDSKVVEIDLDFLPPHQHFKPLELRLVITRNGIGQL